MMVSGSVAVVVAAFIMLTGIPVNAFAFHPLTGRSGAKFNSPSDSATRTSSSSSFALFSTTVDVSLGDQVLVKGVPSDAMADPSSSAPSDSAAPPKNPLRPTLTEKEVRALFNLWNDALATGDSRIVARRYSSEPMLLPTISDTPRTNFDTIKEYFDIFLQLKPQGVILYGKIRIGQGWALDAGIYEFTMSATGAKVKARYSFMYVYEMDKNGGNRGQWKISHHHSSVMPEGKAEIEEAQVRNLFYLWNDALDTLDSDLVASRYTKDAVLLPTVSDKPRTDYAGIKEYFDMFLKLKPQGQIISSYVTIGDGWCKDVGIYEFNMGATGAKVKARYSFVYTKEDGQWKISHHHSSAMPEGGKPKITEAQVKGLFTLWNDALATLDSDKVTKRYATKAVLLPTVSDTPRTDYASIKNYFDRFLQSKPQGIILESYPQVGNGWCKDVGIYEFTMGTTGDKVKARYSFVYTYEDNEWKISHHHSSVMPEAYL